MNYKLLFFHASYCAPCKAMQPTIDELASKIDIEDIDVDDVDESILAKYKIRNIPVLILEKDGTEVWKHIGSISKSELEKKLEEYA